jgi:hypothetical protein
MLSLRSAFPLLIGAAFILMPSAFADKAEPLSALAQMPVKEVTSFKDGHAFVLHEGSMPTNEAGNVVLDYLPAPVLGTFWPYSADKDAKLSSVVASQHKVMVPQSALNVQEFIEANPGAQVVVTGLKNGGTNNMSSITYDAQILGIPVRSSDELEHNAPPNSGEKLPIYGECVLLKTATGVATVPLSKIEYVTFKGNYDSKLSREEFRNLLTLKLDWSKGQAPKNAEVGMMYLQKGIRWIPEYKVNIDGNGLAHVKMQATIVNDLVDLKDVAFHLVVGVPTFSFKDNADPIALQGSIVSTLDQLQAQSRTALQFNNAIMSQAPMAREEESGESSSPTVSSAEKNEDLFVYTVKHITLAKGQRMVVPVREFDLKYKDIYTIALPFTPPQEIMQQFNQNQQSEIDKLMRAPKFTHKIRLSNKADSPLTTAPALILRNDKVICQGMMTYTAAGASSDLALTTAVDLKVTKQDKETQRVPNAVSWRNEQYGRVDLAGSIAVKNYGAQSAELEVTRYILGKTGTADHDGKCEMVNIFENSDYMPNGSPYPIWWGWYSWPNWWSRFNGVGKITWHNTLKPNDDLDLSYTWSYFWR